MVLAATNRPWKLDNAMKRRYDILILILIVRFDKFIYIPLPDPSSRSAMIQKFLGNVPHKLVPSDFYKLGIDR